MLYSLLSGTLSAWLVAFQIPGQHFAWLGAARDSVWLNQCCPGQRSTWLGAVWVIVLFLTWCCPGQSYAWLGAVRVSLCLTRCYPGQGSGLSRTALRVTQWCLVQHYAWLSIVLDSFWLTQRCPGQRYASFIAVKDSVCLTRCYLEQCSAWLNAVRISTLLDSVLSRTVLCLIRCCLG